MGAMAGQMGNEMRWEQIYEEMRWVLVICTGGGLPLRCPWRDGATQDRQCTSAGISVRIEQLFRIATPGSIASHAGARLHSIGHGVAHRAHRAQRTDAGR